MPKNKIPKSENFASSKTPKNIVNPNSYYSKSPSWRFSKADNEHERWSFTKNDVFGDMDIVGRLSDFEKQVWQDIIGDRNHFIDTHRLIKEARDRMVDLGLYYDSVFSLTLNGRERIFGIMEDGVLFFLWYDRKHEICPSPKKHT